MAKELLKIFITILVVLLVTGSIWGALNENGGGLFIKKGIGERITLKPEALETLTVKTGAAKVYFHYTDDEPYVNYAVIIRGLFLKKQGVTVESAGKTTTIATLPTGFFIGTIKYTIEIWCPKETIEFLEIKLSAGELEAPDFKLKNLDCNISAGSVNIGRVAADNAQIGMSAGNSSFEVIEAKNLLISISAGDVVVKSGAADKLKASLSAGNVDVSGSYGDVDISVSAGDIKVENESMPKRLSCSLSAGSARLLMPESESGFTLNYSKSAGSIDSDFPLTGNLFGNKGTVKYAGGEGDFTVKVTAGEIRLEKRSMSNRK